MAIFEAPQVNKGVKPPNEKNPWNLEPGEWQYGKNIIFTLSGIESFYGFTKKWDNYAFPQRIIWITDIKDTILFFGKTKIFKSFNDATPEECKYRQKLGTSDGGNTYTFSSYIYNLDKGTVKIQYTRGGTSYDAWDKDSDGKLYENGGANQVGTVDYTATSSQFSLDFSTVGAPDDGTDINLKETKFTLASQIDYWKEFSTPQWVGFCSTLFKPLKWDDEESFFEPIGDAPIARVMWYQDRHLLAAGGGQGENKIAWSDLDNPENWSSGEAGSGYLDLDSWDTIQFVTNIGGRTYIFSSRRVWTIEYIGYPGYWKVKSALKEVGALSPNAIAEFGDEALIFMNDAAYNVSGVNISPIQNGLLETLYQHINPNKLDLFFSIFDEYTKHVFFIYNHEEKEISTWNSSTSYSVGDEVRPTASKDNGYYYKCTVAGTSGASEPTWPAGKGETVTDNEVTWECVGTYEYCDKCILYNYDLNTWNLLEIGNIQAAGFWRESGDKYIDDIDTIIDEANTLIDTVSYSSNFPILIFVFDDGYCYKLDYSKIYGDSEIISGYIPLEEHKIAQKRKLLTDLQIKGNGKINVKIGYAKYINSEIVWSDPQEYTFGEKEELEWVTHNIEGKYIIIKFYNTGNNSFEINGFVVQYEYVGEE